MSVMPDSEHSSEILPHPSLHAFDVFVIFLRFVFVYLCAANEISLNYGFPNSIHKCFTRNILSYVFISSKKKTKILSKRAHKTDLF